MTLEGLRCFCALIEAGSFREAAERVHRSQPAVSQQLKALERETRQPLLDRRTHRPTPAGEILYERGRRLVTAADALRREMRDFDEYADQALRVGTSDTNALYFLPSIVGQFSEELPRTRIEIYSRSSESITEDVRRGLLDLGIVTLSEDNKGLEYQELFEQQLVLAVPSNHKLASRRRVSVRQLKDEPFVLLSEQTRTGALLRRFFRENDVEPRVVLDSGSFEVLKRYVAERLGISVIPRMVIGKSESLSVVTVRITHVPSITIAAVWPEGSRLTRPARVFLEFLRKAEMKDDRPSH